MFQKQYPGYSHFCCFGSKLSTVLVTMYNQEIIIPRFILTVLSLRVKLPRILFSETISTDVLGTCEHSEDF
jgi:hypothetical protein